MKSKCLFLLILVATANLLPCKADPQVVKIATLEWIPYTGTNIINGGLATEIVTKVFDQAGYSNTVSYMPWKEVMANSQSNLYHAIFPAYYSDERMKIYLISEPFLAGPVVLCTKKDDLTEYSSLKDLKDYKIGVVKAYVNSKDFDKADFLTKIEGKSDLENLKALCAGELDIIAIDKLVATSLIKSNKKTLGTLGNYKFLSPTLGMRDMYVMFPRNDKKSEQLLKDFNESLEVLLKRGEPEKILKKHGFL